MFEALLDSAASAAALETSPSKAASSKSASSETSRTAAATGKAYRALKELVRATLLPLRAARHMEWPRSCTALTHPTPHPTPSGVAP